MTGKVLDVELGEVTPANIEQLKIINSSTLPVRYSDKFYNDLTKIYNSEYLQLAFCNGFAVGGVCARIEDHPDKPGKKRLYVMTINVLAPYRRRGIASRLLKHILNKAELDEHIGDVYLHVQVGNEDAKGFYLNHGFAEIDLIKGYYKKIEPADCYLLVKVLKQ